MKKMKKRKDEPMKRLFFRRLAAASFCLLFFLSACSSAENAPESAAPADVRVKVVIEAELDEAGRVIYDEEKREVQYLETPVTENFSVPLSPEKTTVKDVLDAVSALTGKKAAFDEAFSRYTVYFGIENQGSAFWYAAVGEKSVRMTRPVMPGEEIRIVFGK